MERLFSAIAGYGDEARLFLLPKLLTCAVIIAIGLIAQRLGKAFIKKSFERGKHAKGASAPNIKKLDTARTISLSLYKYGVTVIVILMLLQTFSVNLASILTVAGVGGLAIGIGAQSLVKDLLNGLLIWFEEQYAVGDNVTVMNLSGVVEEFSLRTTKIRSLNGDLHIIPNSDIHSVTNSSKGFKRVVIDVGISYQEDPDRAIKVMEEELAESQKSIPGVMGGAKVLGVQSYLDSSVNIRLVAPCEPSACYDIERLLRKRLLDRFKAEGIDIPYPIITLSGK